MAALSGGAASPATVTTVALSCILYEHVVYIAV